MSEAPFNYRIRYYIRYRDPDNLSNTKEWQTFFEEAKSKGRNLWSRFKLEFPRSTPICPHDYHDLKLHATDTGPDDGLFDDFMTKFLGFELRYEASGEKGESKTYRLQNMKPPLLGKAPTWEFVNSNIRWDIPPQPPKRPEGTTGLVYFIWIPPDKRSEVSGPLAWEWNFKEELPKSRVWNLAKFRYHATPDEGFHGYFSSDDPYARGDIMHGMLVGALGFELVNLEDWYEFEMFELAGLEGCRAYQYKGTTEKLPDRQVLDRYWENTIKALKEEMAVTEE